MLDRFDQAQGLRRLFARTSVRVVPLAVAESEPFAAFAAALAAGLARLGHRPVLLDADRARLAPALGLRARYDLLHVLRGDCGIDAALCPDEARGFALLPAARGLDALAGRDDVAQLFTAFGRLRPAFDTALVAAPVERLVRVLGAGIEPLVLAATDPAGVQAAWRQVAAMRKQHGLRRARVAWCVAAPHSAVRAHGLLAEALARHLGMDACDGGAFAGPADADAIGRIAAGALEAASVEFSVPPAPGVQAGAGSAVARGGLDATASAAGSSGAAGTAGPSGAIGSAGAISVAGAIGVTGMPGRAVAGGAADTAGLAAQAGLAEPAGLDGAAGPLTLPATQSAAARVAAAC